MKLLSAIRFIIALNGRRLDFKVMSGKLLVILTLFLCFFSEVGAQSLMKNGEIPQDLIIKLKRTGRFENYTITIKANGECTFDGYAGLPKSGSIKGGLLTTQAEQKNSIKSNSETGKKVNKVKLQELISEFEKIKFFEIGKSYPQETGVANYISDQSTEVISIQINGQIKEVSNYLGDSGNRAEMLRNLGNKIKDARFLSFNGNVIPEDLVIKYWNGSGIGWTGFLIKSDGKVFYKTYSNMPSNPDSISALLGLDKIKNAKKPELKSKLSEKQLRELISEFEKVDIFSFPSRQLSNQDGCTQDSVSSNAKETVISLQMLGKSATVSANRNCGATVGSIAEKFENLEKKIVQIVGTVKAERIK